MSTPDPIDSAVETAARNWINTVIKANQWRLQILSKRFRKDPETGRRRVVPTRIRRFVEGCPASGLSAVIEVLLKAAPYTGVLFNGQKIPGSFRPTLTEWRRDDNAVVNGLGRTDGTYTLIQDLIEETADGDTDEGPSTGSCSERIETLYVWDAVAMEALPEPTQGVTYGVQRVNRADDGTFSYAVVKRTALTQFGAETRSADTAFDTTWSRTYKNLYGAPETGFLDDTGAAVAVPGPDTAAPGETIERSVQQNDDCTWNVAVQRKVSKSVPSEESSSKTIFESVNGEVSRAQPGELPEAPQASGGAVTSHKSELRPDGRYDNTVQVRQETPVESSSVEKAVTLKGTRVTTVNRNMPSAAVGSGKIGSVVKNDRTDGGLFNQTIVETDPVAVGRTREDCAETALEHRHTTQVNVTEDPGPGCASYGVGFVKERTVSLTDMMTYDVTETTRTARSLSYKSSYGSNLRTISQTVYRNAAGVDVPAPRVNFEVQASLSKNEFQRIDGSVTSVTHNPAVFGPVTSGNVDTTVTTSFGRNKTSVDSTRGTVNHDVDVSVSLNDHGSYDYTKREIAYSSYGPQVIASFGNLIKTTIVRYAKNNTSVPSFTGGVNTDYSISANRNDHGSFDWTAREEKYNPYGPVTVATVNGMLRSTTVTAAYNQTSVAEQTAGSNQDISISASMNPRGSFDWTARKDTYNPYGPAVIATASGTLKSTTVTAAYNQTSVAAQSAGTNQDISISASMNSHGSFDWTARKDTYKPYGPTTIATATGTLKSTTITAAYNQTSVAEQTAETNQDISVSASLNSHGSFDWTARKDTYNPYGPAVIATATGTLKSTTITAAYNQTSVAEQTAGTNQDISVSASLNSHGSFDWTSRTDTYNPYGPTVIARASGTLKSTTITAAYNQTSVAEQTAGSNQDISMSASLNSHGSFDWTSRTDTYNPYGPAVIATATGTLKSTTITAAYNQTSVTAQTAGTNQDISMSASLNSHGSFDWTSRTDTYNPYGPAVIATATGTLKSTTITAAYNQTSVTAQTAGTNQDISISASLNSHGSFDWTSRTDTYKPYGPITIAKVSGTMKTTTITAAYNQSKVSSQSAGTNQDISISASLNSHGSFDWTARKDTYNPYGPVVIATATGTYKTTEIRAAFNQTSVANESAGTNEDISMSASLNSRGSFDWTSRKDRYTPYGPALVATTASPVLTTQHFIGINNTSVTSQAGGNTASSMSVSMNSRGTFDTHEVVRTPTPMSVKATWTAGTGVKQRSYQMTVYRNMSEPVTLNGTYSASASASINEFGLCDGSAVAADGNSDPGTSGTFRGRGGTVAYYVMFQTPGGRRYRQRITVDCERILDTPDAVADFLAGGESIGPYVSRSEGACGRNANGDLVMMGVRYSNVNFDTPEAIS